jgi:uncharacterized protein (DUF1330 family)
MAAYLIVDIEITDPRRYEEYKALVPSLVAAFGGRYLARGGATEVLEGDRPAHRVVVVEFPSAEQARAWWSSAEYAPVKALRQASSRTSMILVNGE